MAMDIHGTVVRAIAASLCVTVIRNVVTYNNKLIDSVTHNADDCSPTHPTGATK